MRVHPRANERGHRSGDRDPHQTTTETNHLAYLLGSRPEPGESDQETHDQTQGELTTTTHDYPATDSACWTASQCRYARPLAGLASLRTCPQAHAAAARLASFSRAKRYTSSCQAGRPTTSSSPAISFESLSISAISSSSLYAFRSSASMTADVL